MRPGFAVIAGTLITLLLGIALGVGAYTFIYAKGYSYVTNDPAACANCHVMEPYYASWMKSPHRVAAVCNDCHTPHDLVGKYTVKGRNGFWHSYWFTVGGYPDPIRITPRNRAVTEAACRHCHQEITDQIEGPRGGALQAGSEPGPRGGISCIRCHAEVGHMR